MAPEASFDLGKVLISVYPAPPLPFFPAHPCTVCLTFSPFYYPGRPGRFRSLNNNHADAHCNLQCLRSGVHGNPVPRAGRWLVQLQPGGPARGLPGNVWLARGYHCVG